MSLVLNVMFSSICCVWTDKVLHGMMTYAVSTIHKYVGNFIVKVKLGY